MRLSLPEIKHLQPTRRVAKTASGRNSWDSLESRTHNVRFPRASVSPASSPVILGFLPLVLPAILSHLRVQGLPALPDVRRLLATHGEPWPRHPPEVGATIEVTSRAPAFVLRMVLRSARFRYSPGASSQRQEPSAWRLASDRKDAICFSPTRETAMKDHHERVRAVAYGERSDSEAVVLGLDELLVVRVLTGL